MKPEPKKLLFVIFLVSLTISPALAGPVLTFRDRSPIVGHQEFLIYEVNQSTTTLLGSFNTSTDQITLDQNSSYILQYTTQNKDYFADPFIIVTDFWTYMSGTYAGWIAIIFIFLLACIALAIAFRK